MGVINMSHNEDLTGIHNPQTDSRGSVDRIYDKLERETRALFDIREDFIIELVGKSGLRELQYWNLVTPCGVEDDQQLYCLFRE